MKMKKWMACAAAFCLSAAMFLSGCGSRPSVHVMKAEQSREPFTLETKAAPEALHTAPVIPQVSGNLISNPPDVGTVVNAGDELFKIDSSQYESQAAALRSQIAAASQAAAPTYTYSAPAVDDSLEASLLKQGIITRAEYDRIKGRKGGGAVQAAPAAEPAQAPAQLVASLQTIEKTIANCTVRAPISGVISQVYIGDTHLAMAGKPSLVIRQDSPVTASVQIPAKLDNVMEKAKDDKTLTVTMSDGSEVWYGELKKQPNENGEKFTTYKVQVDNPDDEITIGNEYSIRIESGQNVSCFMIPKSAIIGDSTVAVVNDDNLVDMKSVSIASDTGGYVLIMDGLAEGDRVITDPPKSLDMGMQVDVK